MYSERENKKGDGLFYSVDDPVLLEEMKSKRIQPKKKIQLENNFCFSKYSNLLKEYCVYPEYLRQADLLLENSIRICDTREYLDTLTVASDLFEDGEKFLKLMVTVSRGNFLMKPCKGQFIYKSLNTFYIMKITLLKKKKSDLGIKSLDLG